MNSPCSASACTAPDIRAAILAKLDELCERHDCRLLLAVESGSRAWGYASQDSDYDVRCIYYHPAGRYLTIRPPRDTIEWELNEVYDINGWDLRKALGMAQRSHLTVFEWCDSPIRYMASPWEEEFRAVIRSVMNPERLAGRYLGMAEGTMKRYLTMPEPPYKEYFYAIRPLLAARWVMQERIPAPVPFDTLRRALLPSDMEEEVDTLLALRNGSTEKACGAPRPRAIAYIEQEITALRTIIPDWRTCPEPDTAPLDDFFRRVVQG